MALIRTHTFCDVCDMAGCVICMRWEDIQVDTDFSTFLDEAKFALADLWRDKQGELSTQQEQELHQLLEEFFAKVRS